MTLAKAATYCAAALFLFGAAAEQRATGQNLLVNYGSGVAFVVTMCFIIWKMERDH